MKDLGPLEGLPIETLDLTRTSPADLTPLRKLPLLRTLDVDFEPFRGDAAVLKPILSLEKINGKPVAEFWKDADAAQAAFDKWCAEVAKLPPDKQAERVAAELKKKNPGFDGKFRADGKNKGVFEFQFNGDEVADLTPIRALAGLENLLCSVSGVKPGPLTNLWPLKGLPLKQLICAGTQLSDLHPLAGSQLTILDLSSTKVTDLGPLRGLPLRILNLYHVPVSDVTPLQNMKLKQLQ